MTRAAIMFLLLLAPTLRAQTNHPIDLPTVLRLAGAQNLDIQLAREKLNEARANRESAIERFLPWVSPGVTYRHHEGRLQDTQGNILDVSKQNYAAGGTIGAQWEIGDAIYKSLETHQLVKASEHGLDAQRADTVLAAAQGYFDLAKAQAAVGVAEQALNISRDYEQQISHAVEAGIAFKGDALRVRVQMQRNELLLRQSKEQQRIAAARLSETLHLDSIVELTATDTDLVPISLVNSDTALEFLVQQALTSRPELKQSKAVYAAARDAKNGAVFGPLIPTVGAQAFVGGLGGGTGGQTGNFGESEDYLATLSWRIGPGGLFDMGRIHATDARMKTARYVDGKVKDQVTRQVVESVTRVRSLSDQIVTAKRSLADAQETLRLSLERKEFGVGIVLESIQSEQDLTRARTDYVTAVAEFNKAQYALRRATGAPADANAK
jgi:outer membrane protein TolC